MITDSGQVRSGKAKPIAWARHTMGPALLPYLELKVHSIVQQYDWRRITVVGQYDRSCIVSSLEKDDKLFNWQRPTAEVAGSELVLKCFPGRDYVYHYALLTATYLAMTGRFREQVHFRLPRVVTCDAAVARVNLQPSQSKAVILGWGITQLGGVEGWTFGEGYAWKQATNGGLSILFVGFLHSIWGDVAGRVVARLARLGARRVLYVGKVGALDPSLSPNTVLATGNHSLVDNRSVIWEDFFDSEVIRDPMVVTGTHVTSPSTLLETEDWLARYRGYAFVDPEIGRMGAAAYRAGIPFGYLHVVSNNLACRYNEDLSNERRPLVLTQRARLLDSAQAIIEAQLQRTAA